MVDNSKTCCGRSKCCEKVETTAKLTRIVEHEIEKKLIPFGYGLIHPGIRTADNKYTCPVLEVHTWRKGGIEKTMDEASMTQRNTANPRVGALRGAIQRTVDIDEDIIVIPIESIISIKSSSEVIKGETECRNVRVRTPSPPPKVSCCKKILRCCCCGCCCSKKKVSKRPEEIVTTISDQKAQRKILITIEYIRYNNIHSPSHVRVLTASDQAEFYRQHFYKDILLFYLLNNDVFEQYDFDLKREQASTLCRLVTQLKATVGHYPDEPTLRRIISKPDTLAIGNQADETMGRLTGPATVTTTLELTMTSDRF